MRRRLGMPLLLVESSLDPPEICGLSNVLALLDDDCWQPAKVGHFETREIRDRERAW